MIEMVQSPDVQYGASEDTTVSEPKYPSQGSSYRVNLYMRPEERELFEEVARKLSDNGFTGVLDADGNAVKSEVVRVLLRAANKKTPRK